MIEELNIVFFVDFKEKEREPIITHGKCGTKAKIVEIVIVPNQQEEKICFYCPVCLSFPSKYFFKNAWEQILKDLKKILDGEKITLHMSSNVGETIFSSKPVMILQKRILPE